MVETGGLVFEAPLFRVRRGLQLEFRSGSAPQSNATSQLSSATKNLVLAYLYRRALESGQVRDAKTLAIQLGVKPSRISAVAALVFLAPNLQEEILGLKTTHRLDALGLADLLRLARMPSWEDQRTALALLARS